jgi:tRNA-Thr(GGU) m(6)t(6)A37 methyltransferase TsaA
VNYTFEPIGIIHSCFKEKFGIPRQPGLVPEAEARLEILPPYNRAEAFREIEGYSHLWITFVFHAAMREQWSATVRPPRLGGNRRVGVFASRSPFRPNPIGLSAVKLKALKCQDDQVSLLLAGVDLLDGTPVLDIKPYVPYTDALPNALAGFAPEPPPAALEVSFSEDAEIFLQGLAAQEAEHLQRLIRQILENDPRPAYLADNPARREFGVHLYDYNVRWQVDGRQVLVTAISCVADPIDDKS